MRNHMLIGIFFSILFASCDTNKVITGRYRSNFAQLVFFKTNIVLKSDSTFHYQLSGDLENTELEGIYKTHKDKLYLRFYKLKDEPADAIKIVGKDTIVDFEKLYNTHPYELKRENEIEYHLKFKILKNKLQSYRIDNNKLVKRIKTYSSRKYILFWKKNHSKKYFLKRVEV
ncbi:MULTISPECIES: hypothetical protein [unclassified Arcicella]|nr:MULTISPECIES: hypothetical protein [unclassified Arcicella]MDR6562018.1 hypothetical protein [Arcicella sp. BE51]MDR6822920.1 hypothetical protein [Arcicella sp. BE139]